MILKLRPRYIILISVTIIVAIVAIAAAIMFPREEHSPQTVVHEYFSALQNNDVDSATDYLEHAGGYDGNYDEILFYGTGSNGWSYEITEVVDISDDSSATVHYEIKSRNASTTGAFHLSPRLDSWDIVNPVTVITLEHDTLNFIAVEDHVASSATTVALFPGAYNFYDVSSPYVEFVPQFFISAPNKFEQLSLGGTFAETPITRPEVTSIADQDEVLEEVDNWLHECLSSNELAPGNCPFSAFSDAEGAYVLGEEVLLAEDDAAAVEWTMETPPQFRFSSWNRLTTSSPGTATVTVEHQDGETVEAECAIGFDGVDIVLNSPDNLTFVSSGTGPDCVPLYDWMN